MKLTVFQSDKGDCLLLTSKDSKTLMSDGGMSNAYTDHVAPMWQQLKLKSLDVVYVSHIDSDHISGILRMVNDLADWRVFDFKGGKQPKSFRPPEIKELWHNAFHQQVGDNEGKIEDMLAANAVVLSADDKNSASQLMMQGFQNLITSKTEAINLSNRVSPKQLNIPLNRPAKGKLMMVRDNKKKTIKLGSLSISLLGPYEEDLNNLRDEWNKWLKENQKTIKEIQQKAKDDEGRFATNEIGNVGASMVSESEMLREFQLEQMTDKLKELETETRKRLKKLQDDKAPSPLSRFEEDRLSRISDLMQSAEPDFALAEKVLGLRDKVTTPNLASLMLLVTEGAGAKKKTLVLTGDGHAREILKGLKLYMKPDKKTGRIRLDVLKVQHHGAENNIDTDFCQQVVADIYIFCGNGEHKNPDLDVLKLIFDSRMIPGDSGNFKFWFNSSSKATEGDKTHMKKVETLVSQLQAKSNGRLTLEFLDDHSFELSI
ncbi:MAG TPA: MBL fold metallo-hydrolase [Pyrinomonadaceae bacterium]|jgi:beta-lactamase superfamily II metal-dependent hydrolase